MLPLIVTSLVQFVLWLIAGAVIGKIVVFSPVFWLLFVLFVIIGVFTNMIVRLYTGN